MNGEQEPLLKHAGLCRRSNCQGAYGLQMPQDEHENDSSQSTGVNYGNKMRRCAKKFIKTCCNKETVVDKFPIIKWLPQYSLLDLQSDIISGLTVALTVLPQGLAYALVANLPQQYGLYSAFMGCFVYTVFGTSKDITLGPTAIMALLTASFATSPFEDDPTYAIILCLECGFVQIMMAFLHLGIIVNFISFPVISAFTSAAAITIAFGQVKSVLGLSNIPSDFLPMVYETFQKISQTKIWDLTMGLTCIVILILLKMTRNVKWKMYDDGLIPLRKRVWMKFVWLLGIGANAVTVIAAAGLVAILNKYGYHGKLSVTGVVKKGLPPFQPPSFSITEGNRTIEFQEIMKDMGSGLIIVPLLGLVEAIAIGKAFARQNNYRIKPNQELLAIGAANIISSFVSSFPVTGSFTRTAVNSQSGVRTPLGGVFTGGIVLLALQFLTPLFEYIPKSALGAVIIVAVLQMVEFKILLKFWKIEKIALIPWTVTFLLSFIVGIEYGILIGVGVSLLILMYPIARPRILLNELYSDDKDLPSTHGVIPQGRYLEHVVVTFNQAIKFPSIEFLQLKILDHMTKDGEVPRSVVLDCTFLTAKLDYTTVVGFTELIFDLKKKGIHIVMANVLPHIRKEMEKAGLNDITYRENVADAIRKIKEADSIGVGGDTVESVVVVNGQIVGVSSVNGLSQDASAQNVVQYRL